VDDMLGWKSLVSSEEDVLQFPGFLDELISSRDLLVETSYFF